MGLAKERKIEVRRLEKKNKKGPKQPTNRRVPGIPEKSRKSRL
jgi:hypothetical protein